MPGQVVRLPSSRSAGEFGQSLFDRFAKKLMPDPVLDHHGVLVSKEQGVKTPDFSVSLACGCSPLAVEVKTMEPRRTEVAYAEGKARVMDGMEHVVKIRRLINKANEQLVSQERPGILVTMTGPDERALLPVGSGLSAIDMAMGGNHVANILVPDDPGERWQFSHWSRDDKPRGDQKKDRDEGAQTRDGKNTAISAVMLLDRQWHTGDLWELSLVGLRNTHAKFPICSHFAHESIHLFEDATSINLPKDYLSEEFYRLARTAAPFIYGE